MNAWESFDYGDSEPYNFGVRAWNAYLDCVSQPCYYFSVDEIVGMACVAGLNLCVFQHSRDNLLQYAGGSFTNDRGGLVCIKLRSNSRRRVRTHFERLISSNELDSLRRDSMDSQGRKGAAKPGPVHGRLGSSASAPGTPSVILRESELGF